ncbi:MAG: phosphate ABC transporter substrate-binding protein PstS [Burkholderiales bacterium]|nr:phosphate ABC transporter substrate-binding protein PstS [Burkholderiales bacterium]
MSLKRNQTVIFAWLAPLLLALFGVAHAAPALTGAGSTFAEPLYKKWGEMYSVATLTYDGVGSGEGINRIIGKKVDFGASDEPLKRADLDAKGLRQFPIAVGAIVPVVNLPGVPAGELKLSPEILAKIYLGKIKRWNDPEIANLNDAVASKLPALPIKPVYRSDGSGSTFVVTFYLAARVPDWQRSAGVDKLMHNVVGQGAQGTGGVVDLVKKTSGAIGYVDYGRAAKEQLSIVQLPNRVGIFLKAGAESIQAAMVSDAEKLLYSSDPDFYLVLADNDTYGGWPLTTATFIVLPRAAKEAQHALDFMYWGLRNGDESMRQLGYVPLTESMKVAVRKAWSRQYGFKAGL